MLNKPSDIIHGFYHKNLAEEINRLLLDCNKIGIFITKKEATALIAERSRRGFMPKADILNYIKQLKGINIK
jgi:predicted ABC-type ATPase